jgi:transcription antitermination factor NusB
MGKRRQGREAALKLLYALDMTHTDVQEVLNATWIEEVVPHDVRDFVMKLVTGVEKHREEIDTMIRAWSSHWSLTRIGAVERNLLRLAIYELVFMPEIPPNVTINEAIEVAKSYGAEEAWLFVNGILDRVKHEMTPQHAEAALPEIS